MTAPADTHRGVDSRGPRSDPARSAAGDGPAAEAAVAYAQDLGWPLTPGFAVDGGRCGCDRAQCAQLGAHPVPGAFRVAACSTPALVRVVWRMCTGAPVLAVLGRPVPGVARLGAVSAPTLIGVAALELLLKRTATQGPVLDGFGRISFLVDLGPGEPYGPLGQPGPGFGGRARHEAAAHDAVGDAGSAAGSAAGSSAGGAADGVAPARTRLNGFECWRQAGMDLSVLGAGAQRECVPLPTPGFGGPSGVVWAVKPRPDGKVPSLAAVADVFDRAVRSTYPSLWRTVHGRPRGC